MISSSALADQIIVNGLDPLRSGGVMMKESGTEIWAGYVGVILLTVNSGGQSYSRDSLCVDLFTNIYLGQTYDTTVQRPDEVQGKHLGRVSWLVDNALLPTQGVYASTLAVPDWVTSQAQGMGIQLAIWDIVHDAGNGFSAGSVQAATQNPTNSTVLYWAQRYLDLSLGQRSDLAFIYNNFQVGASTQVQMLAGPKFADQGPAPPAPPPIVTFDETDAPEPSTFALFTAAGLLALAAARRRTAVRRRG